MWLICSRSNKFQREKDKFKNIKSAIKDFQRGKFVIIIDDEGRENEGDLVLAAEKANFQKLNFIIKHARGLMCLPCEDSVINRLHIPPMTENSTDRFQTPFTVSVDAKENTTSGVSVFDRMEVLKILLNPQSKKSDLAMPGHSFPLKARGGLLKERRGHTEATVELLKLAKLKPVGVIAEIMKDNGYMARLPFFKKFSKKFNIAIISVSEIIDYRIYLEERGLLN